MSASTIPGVNVFEYCPGDLAVSMRGMASYRPDDEIPFADPIVRDVCIKTWGDDGRFTFSDAVEVKSMGEHRHEELKYDDTSLVFDEIEAIAEGFQSIDEAPCGNRKIPPFLIADGNRSCNLRVCLSCYNVIKADVEMEYVVPDRKEKEGL